MHSHQLHMYLCNDITQLHYYYNTTTILSTIPFNENMQHLTWEFKWSIFLKKDIIFLALAFINGKQAYRVILSNVNASSSTVTRKVYSGIRTYLQVTVLPDCILSFNKIHVIFVMHNDHSLF